MWKKNKLRILGSLLIMSIVLNITGCSNYKSENDNENVNKNKSYSEVALEVLEERYGEPFELKQIGGTFGAYRNTKKLILNPVSNPNTYCFVEVEADKTEVYDDYADRIMEERFAVVLEEEAKKIFDEEINIKVFFNPFYDRYSYLDMEPLEFYKDNVHSQHGISIFVNSDGNIDKNEEGEKLIKFADKVINMGLNKDSSIWVWYCKEETYNEIDKSYYNVILEENLYKYYSDKGKTYSNVDIEILDKNIRQNIDELINRFD